MTAGGKGEQKTVTVPRAEILVPDLKKFYETPAGEILANETRNFWETLWCNDKAKKCHIMCFGYPLPGLRSLAGKGKSFALFSPSFLGPVPFLTRGENQSVCMDSSKIPLREGSYDRILVAHALEYMEDPVTFVEDIWKALSPNGRLILLLPGKKGPWGRVKQEFYACAKIYPLGNLKTFFARNGFDLVSERGALFGLPYRFPEKPVLGRVFFPKILHFLSGCRGYTLLGFEKTLSTGEKEARQPARLFPVNPVPS